MDQNGIRLVLTSHLPGFVHGVHARDDAVHHDQGPDEGFEAERLHHPLQRRVRGIVRHRDLSHGQLHAEPKDPSGSLQPQNEGPVVLGRLRGQRLTQTTALGCTLTSSGLWFVPFFPLFEVCGRLGFSTLRRLRALNAGRFVFFAHRPSGASESSAG